MTRRVLNPAALAAARHAAERMHRALDDGGAARSHTPLTAREMADFVLARAREAEAEGREHAAYALRWQAEELIAEEAEMAATGSAA